MRVLLLLLLAVAAAATAVDSEAPSPPEQPAATCTKPLSIAAFKEFTGKYCQHSQQLGATPTLSDSAPPAAGQPQQAICPSDALMQPSSWMAPARRARPWGRSRGALACYGFGMLRPCALLLTGHPRVCPATHAPPPPPLAAALHVRISTVAASCVRRVKNADEAHEFLISGGEQRGARTAASRWSAAFLCVHASAGQAAVR